MKLIQAALALSLALLFAVGAWHFSETNIKFAVLLAGLALILSVIGASLLADWIVDRVDEHDMIRAEINATTPQTRYAEAIGNLTTEQLMVLSRQSASIEMLISQDYPPVYGIRSANGTIPLDFVTEYLKLTNLSTGELYPIRNYGEGSHARAWATDLTDLLTGSLHFAEPAVGSRPARLFPHVTLAQVAYHLGVEL